MARPCRRRCVADLPMTVPDRSMPAVVACRCRSGSCCLGASAYRLTPRPATSSFSPLPLPARLGGLTERSKRTWSPWGIWPSRDGGRGGEAAIGSTPSAASRDLGDRRGRSELGDSGADSMVSSLGWPLLSTLLALSSGCGSIWTPPCSARAMASATDLMSFLPVL